MHFQAPKQVYFQDKNNNQNMENEQGQNNRDIRINAEQTTPIQFQEPKWMKILQEIVESQQGKEMRKKGYSQLKDYLS